MKVLIAILKSVFSRRIGTSFVRCYFMQSSLFDFEHKLYTLLQLFFKTILIYPLYNTVYQTYINFGMVDVMLLLNNGNQKTKKYTSHENNSQHQPD
jgi:hypothetical protein